MILSRILYFLCMALVLCPRSLPTQRYSWMQLNSRISKLELYSNTLRSFSIGQLFVKKDVSLNQTK